MIALGSLADREGPRAALLVSGVAFVAIGGLVAVRRESRELDAPVLETAGGT
jgi:hypothetical protein